MIKLSTGTTEGLQKITPEQKIPLASEWTVIMQEYAVITEQAAIADVAESAEFRSYKAAYAALDDFLHNADTGILADFTALSFVEPSVYQKKWNDYYTARAKLRLIMAIPPTNQVTEPQLTAIANDANKTIDITVTFRYTQGLFPASHFLLYRATDIHAHKAINTDKADTHIIAVLPDAPDNHEYSINLNLPQVSGSAQLHYRFAVTAAFLGAGSLALHSDGIIDGGESWRDVTVGQPETGSVYNYWNYTTGELRAGKKDNYIRLNPETNELEHKGITIDIGQDVLRNDINTLQKEMVHYEVCTAAADEKIKTVNIADFSLKKGIKICIQFTNGNTADEPRLNVSGTGDKPITMDGAAVYTGCFDTGGVYEFVYDGVNWECLSGTVRTKGRNSDVWYTKYRNGLLIQKFINNNENNPQTFVFPIAYRDSEYMIAYSSIYLRTQKIITQQPTMCKIMQYMSLNDSLPFAGAIQIMTIGY